MTFLNIPSITEHHLSRLESNDPFDSTMYCHVTQPMLWPHKEVGISAQTLHLSGGLERG